MGLLDETIVKIQPADSVTREKAKQRLDQLTMPHWALGRLMDLALDLAGMTRSTKPEVDKRVVVVMAGDHGVASEGVSNYPQEVTVQMVHNFLNGGAGINAVSRVSKSDVVVVDMGVASDIEGVADKSRFISKKIRKGTDNILKGPAMNKQEAIGSVEAGIEVALKLGSSYNLFATGDMGIGNTTPSSAIVSAITGLDPALVTGRGTGIDADRFEKKVKAIEKILLVNRPDAGDAIDILAKVGGFEIGGIAGLILGVASMRKPVLIDGFISTAGALIASGICPSAKDYMIASHRSVEQGHQVALRHLNKEPLMDL
ncbi:MAG: nicotinate-nucleotide--dimethylbenzimidazole phosphoribosyltransferase, partial [Desulfomonilaceae bacterium]